MLGAEGIPMVGALGVEALAEAPRLQLAEVRDLGGDVMHRWVRG
jgi:diaminohydroxyphosphoribosylaminopyrimidine deaminase/5-amino-6-(5-phosphoribosylamino)uracil reductase